MARTSYIRWYDIRLALNQQDKYNFYFARSHMNNSSRVGVLLHSDIISWFRANKSLILLFKATYLAEKATNKNFIVFGFTRPGLEPTIYRTQSEHANHYTTDAICCAVKCLMTTFVLLYFFYLSIVLSVLLRYTVSDCSFGIFWPLCCLFFFDIRFLIAPLVSFDRCVVCSSSIYGFWLLLWYLLTVVLSVLLRCTDSDYLFGIFKLFLHCSARQYKNTEQQTGLYRLSW